MSKGQINFRIEESLLKAIKSHAQNEGIPYTLWIIKQCRLGLGLDSPVPSHVYQTSSTIDTTILDKRIAEILDTRLKDIQLLDDDDIDKRIVKILGNELEERIVEKLSDQENAPTERIDESISNLREKEIFPILSRLENLEALLERIEKIEAVPIEDKVLDPDFNLLRKRLEDLETTDFNLEVDPITPNETSPIIESIGSSVPIEIDPLPTSDLEKTIRAYLKKNEGKTTSASNLFKGLKITGNIDKQYTAKKILKNLGCTQTTIRAGNREVGAWTIPIHED